MDGNPRNVKWVMVVNLNPGGIAGGSGGQYFVGDFDGTTFTSDDPPTYTPPTGTVLAGLRGHQLRPLDHHRHRLRRRPDRRQRPRTRQASPATCGDQLANSFHGGDGTVGTLTSPDFTVNQTYLNFLIGGGNHPHVPGTSSSSEPPAGHVALRRLRVPDDTNLAEAGWTADRRLPATDPAPAPSATSRR